MKKILIALDIGNEFGWMLCRFQAKVRYMAKDYNDVYVVTTPDRMFVYEDFAKPYTEITKEYHPDMWRFRDCAITYIYPHKALCQSVGNDKFIKFGKKLSTFGEFGEKKEGLQCIAVHMRKKLDGREWGESKWQEFVGCLEKETKLPIVSIGSNLQIHNILANLCWDCSGPAILASSVLCIGPSSGAMHLASLCGCEHLVWTDRKIWNLGFKKGTNRERYETAWNPLETPVTVIDDHGWDPPVSVILNETRRILRRKGVVK
jgi:hypothetical protein